MKDTHRRHNTNYKEFSNTDKTLLKQRIMNSVYGYVQRKRTLKYGIIAAAAVCVLIISSAIFLDTYQQTSAIEGFAKTTENENTLNEIQLVLNKGQHVQIASNEKEIIYSGSGQTVSIGKSKSINQQAASSKKPVFNTLIVPYGKRSAITLSDGTKVWLNSGSKLIFPAVFIEDQRSVYLEGEAIFEVFHDAARPFKVKSHNHEVEVLGTVFNVSNYANDEAISTVLKTGSVQINFDKDSFFNRENHLKITPGTMAVFNKEKQTVKTDKVDVERYFSWRDGVFIFKNDSLKSIMKKIARYYNVQININDENLAKQTFSGSLDVTDSIENLIKTINETESKQFNFYKTKDGKWIIN